MNKADLQAAFGSLDQIGALFKPVNGGKPLTRSAVSLWTKRVPKLREYQLREVVPDLDARIAKARKQGRPRA